MSGFGDLDKLAINTIRCLSLDAVQKAQSGHPGAPMGCAPMAHVLFSRVMKFNPSNSKWFNRDRFVLSNGHGCALQYTLLHLLGYKITMNDLQQFRQVDSVTPGHPEVHLTDGIEVTTGPLGQGISNAVGLAVAEQHLRSTFNRPGFSVVDNYIFCIAGDGCLQEGVSSEACSLAGHWGLGHLIVLYDDNSIQIDGSTNMAFTEDSLKRYESYGWHTQSIVDGDGDLNGILEAIEKAKAVKDKPSIIKIKTTIGFGSKLQGTEKVHGSALQSDDVAAIKKKFGFDPERTFFVPEEVSKMYSNYKQRGQQQEAEWNGMFQKYTEQFPQLAAELQRRINKVLPSNWKDNLPRYTPNDPALATRKTSENVLNAIAESLPELIGGSADLTHSNLTRWKTAVDFQKDDSGMGNYSGRYFRFGVREHGMSAICNGLAAYGAIIPFGATFLNFLGYAQGAVRLTALSHFRVIYIMTHDSIGLGEDGPTHQPIEIMSLIRATPNMLVFRPADGNETSAAYMKAIETHNHPSVMCLSRQNLPQLEGSSIEKAFKGGYVLQDHFKKDEKPAIILVGTGSEVSICVDAAKLLVNEGVKVRIVSLPSFEVFEEQGLEYQKTVFLPRVPVLSVEAYYPLGWERFAHYSVGMTSFGSSGPYKDVYKKFGITSQNVADKAKQLMKFYENRPAPYLLDKMK